jgi:hypothetical protein
MGTPRKAVQQMKTKEVHGSARLSEDGKYLTITVQAKRGAKYIENKQVYLVEDVNPHPNVANPAYSLTKGTLTKTFEVDDAGHEVEVTEFVPTSEVWHVSVGPWGPDCDCPHRTFNPNSPICKHGKAMVAVGKLSENKEPA